MKPFTPQEVTEALPKISPGAQLELHNAMLAARVEAYEAIEIQHTTAALEVDDGVQGQG